MKIALKIVSIVCVSLGGLAILGVIVDPVDGFYAIVGGGLYLTEGILALVYMKGK